MFPRAALLLVVICLTDLAYALARIYNSVRCVKSESFEALPRWLKELENLIAPEVVKVIVGNKLKRYVTIRVLFTRILPPQLLTSQPSSHPHIGISSHRPTVNRFCSRMYSI